jgi:hypothetical protein
MARLDFNWIPFTHDFTENDPTLTVEFPIDGTPIDDGYLLITAHNVTFQTHQILINNQELPGYDFALHSGWQTWMNHIPSGYLHSGTNSILVVRIGNDDFTTKEVVVHWREWAGRHESTKGRWNECSGLLAQIFF